MKDLFDRIDSDENSRKLISIAARVFQETHVCSTLKPEERIVSSLEDLDTVTRYFKSFGSRVVLTMGTFDLFHVGHARYIKKARQAGSLLIVGVEDDEKARGRKGENRPVIPFNERAELLTYLRFADVVARKSSSDPKWGMIKIVRPDVLIGVEGTYELNELESLKEFCGEVVILERQAQTSTSAQVRKMALDGADSLTRILTQRLPDFILGVYQEMKKG